MVTTSRIELLKQRELLERAILGIDLLEERLSSLLKEFKTLAKEISVSQEELALVDQNAMENLGLANTDEGPLMGDLADKTDKDIRLSIDKEKIYGVAIPKIPKTTYRGQKQKNIFPVTVSSAVNITSRHFEELFFAYLNYIEQVIILQRLGNEIKQTRRQISVLENNIVPNLRGTINQIEFTLEEREREEQIRLRRFKEKKGRK